MLRKLLSIPAKYFNGQFQRLVDTNVEQSRFQSGIVIEELRRSHPPQTIGEAGYKVYSQFDQDGIIQHIIRHCPGIPRFFIEFGVEDYRESSTRFLLEKDFWRGLIVDPSAEAQRFLERSGLLWSHDLVFRQSFLTRENINEILAPSPPEPGLLVIDVDGNDYYLWEALRTMKPWIVSVEYQSLFGPKLDVCTPYEPTFDRRAFHSSNLAYGASLSAMQRLAAAKGYRLIGGSRQHHDAFFVREDVPCSLPTLRMEEVFTDVQHRENLDDQGRLTYLRERHRQRLVIKDAPLFNFSTGTIEPFGNFIDGEGHLLSQ